MDSRIQDNIFLEDQILALIHDNEGYQPIRTKSDNSNEIHLSQDDSGENTITYLKLGLIF